MSNLKDMRWYLDRFQGTRGAKVAAQQALLNLLVPYINKHFQWASGPAQEALRANQFTAHQDLSLYGLLQRITLTPVNSTLMMDVDILPGTVLSRELWDDKTSHPFQQVRLLKVMPEIETRLIFNGYAPPLDLDGWTFHPALPAVPEVIWCQPSLNKHLLSKGRLKFKRVYRSQLNARTPLVYVYKTGHVLASFKQDITKMAYDAGLRLR